MPFNGFPLSDFDIFATPDFDGRMVLLKANLTPKLRSLGDDLSPRLSEVIGEPLYPHVALHLRRSVNAPVSTWVAFAKERRAYKPYVHLRAAIGLDGFRLVVFVEDYADEKETFGKNMARLASPLAKHLKAHPEVLAYHVTDAAGKPLSGSSLDAKTLRAFGERMLKVKGQHASFGVPFGREDPVVASGPKLEDAIVDAARTLKPLYDLGRSRG